MQTIAKLEQSLAGVDADGDGKVDLEEVQARAGVSGRRFSCFRALFAACVSTAAMCCVMRAAVARVFER